MNWIDQEGLMFVQMLSDNDWGKCKTSSGLFEVLSEEFKPKHKEKIFLFQYYRLPSKEKYGNEEWVGHIRIKAKWVWIKRKG